MGQHALMAAGLERQRALLEGVLAAVEREPCIRFLELRGSLARATADPESDIDLRIGVVDRQFDAFADTFGPLLSRLGAVADILRHDDPELAGIQNERWFVLFDDGRQLDCATVPLSTVKGRGPATVVLYDPDHRGRRLVVPPALDGGSAEVEEWTALAWLALIDVCKHMTRGAHLEAHLRIEEARQHALRLWAVARGVDYPALGIVALLDEPVPHLPPGLDSTYCDLSSDALRQSGLACVALLDVAAEAAASATGATIGTGFRDWVVPRLSETLSR